MTMRSSVVAAAVGAALLVSPASRRLLAGQRGGARASAAAAASSGPYGQLKFRYIGPVGNRISAVAGVPGDPNVYYAGSASGGIFKTADAGATWDPIFDGEPVASIGSLAVAPGDPNIVWAGTGETWIRSHISLGAGIYKSIDAGKTWTLMGLDKTGRIGRIVIDPHDPNIVFAAALGHSYGPQPDRGLFRTTDGGKTWQKVLFVDENTGCSDVAMDPSNPRVLFAGMWQFVIHTWAQQSGGPGSGLFKSTDGGTTWTRLAGHGLPDQEVGKIGLAIARSDPARVYALIETGTGEPFHGKPTAEGELWRSDDGGANWRMMTPSHDVGGRPHYYFRMGVEPDNPDDLYFLTASFSRSQDGGATLRTLRGYPTTAGGHALGAPPLGDFHDIWIDPTNADRMIVSNDGGVGFTVNRGRTWQRVQFPNAQVYHVAVDDQIPYDVYGNRQDGPSFRGPSNSRVMGYGQFVGPISRGLWQTVGGGESGWTIPDWSDPNIVWSSGTASGSLGGSIDRYDERTRQYRSVEVWPDNPEGWPAGELEVPVQLDLPGRDVALRSQQGVGRQPVRARDDRRRTELARHQPGSHAERQEPAGTVGRPDRRQHRARVRRHAHRDRRLAETGRRHLDRQQRRPGAGDARRRQALDERHGEHPGPAAVGDDLHGRAVAVRRRDGVHHRRSASAGQPRSVRVQDRRFRPDVDESQRDNPARPAELRAQHRRGSGAAGPAVPRHGEFALRVVRRRRRLAAAAEQSAARTRVRHHGAAALPRSRARDLRTRLLDPRRHHAARADDERRGDGRDASVPAASGLSLPRHHAAGRAVLRSRRRRQSAVRRRHHVLPQGQAARRRADFDPRRQRADGPDASRHDRCRAEPRVVGFSIGTDGRGEAPHESNLRAVAEGRPRRPARGRTDVAPHAAGRLHGEAVGRRARRSPSR